MSTNGEASGKGPADNKDDNNPDKKEQAVPVIVEEDGHTVTKDFDFKDVSIPKALEFLKCTENGLSEAEVKSRLEKYGPNKLPESHRNPFLVYLGYMWNPLSWAMEAAAIIAICLLDYADFCLIVALLLLNATISFVEESSADKAIKALTAALAPKAKALRDGKVESIDAATLVPGDIVVVRLGDIVPADIKLLGEDGEHDQPLQVDQAALTGESLPVKKFAGHVAFSGSTIKQGEKHALVYATGANTFFGRAASLIGGTQNVANIQKIMTRIGAICLVTIGVWCVVEIAVQFGYYHHSCVAGEDGCPTLLNMLVIVVGGIPIAMPTVLSVTLALGASKLAKEGAIVARMSAVEEMAGMDILCSDKTGTLTLNQLTINTQEVYSVAGMPVDEILKYGALSAQPDSEEAIDQVVFESYPQHDTLWDNYTLKKFIPFNPVDKFTMAIIEDHQGRTFRVMKGAPQVVLKRAHNAAEIDKPVRQSITDYASKGFRALGIGLAEGASGDKWDMLAVMPMFDPPRHDTAETIKRCQEKGITVKMVTGDQLLIGKETARQLGLGLNMYTTEVLLKHKDQVAAGSKPVDQLVEEADGFAEVFPEHKYEIVELLQGRHHMVAMTGDGVNDAPALKKADVGIAVAGATDAARGAADIVLTEPGLSTIVSAIIGARKIFQRMTTYAKYTVAMTFRICFTFGLLTCIYNWYFPTLLIVLLAVFNDGAMIALSKDRVVASHTPNVWHLGAVFTQGIIYGLYLTLSSWLLYFLLTKSHLFDQRLHMFSLNDQAGVLDEWCRGTLASRPGLSAGASACTLGPAYAAQPTCSGATVMQQCLAEQYYVRNSITRSVIYNHVSISGQALVFVVRTFSHSFFSRAGMATYVAFFGAQVASTIIAIFGFGGYTFPRNGVTSCTFCQLSTGGNPPFFEGHVPLANTESLYTDSVIGCTYYVIVAWIWAIIWHMGLDPLKWAMAYIMNEDGVRDRAPLHRRRKRPAPPPEREEMADYHGGPSSYQNPLGRVSIARPTPIALERSSVFRTDEQGRIIPAPSQEGAQGAPQGFLQRLSRASLTSPRSGSAPKPAAPQQQLADLGPAGGYPAGGRT